MSTGSAIVNGFLSSLAEAQIPLLDKGFLFGQGLFETLLVLDGRIVLWDEHLNRMSAGAQKALIAMPSPNRMLADARRVVQHNILTSGHTAHKMQLRIMLTGGTSAAFWEDSHHDLTPNLMMFCRNIPGISAETYSAGIKLQSTREQRSTQTIDIKSSNYLLQMLAFAEARKNGFDDALFFGSDGLATESTTASFIWIDANHEICTSPCFEKCLPGTTLLTLKNALNKQNRAILEKALPLANLNSAKGAAIVSSTRGVLPVRAIDGYSFEVASLQNEFSILNKILLAEQLERCQ
jgi:branched-subunit amino acid aminotransferase/4-amino-4-deoxychorismate lyase